MSLAMIGNLEVVDRRDTLPQRLHKHYARRAPQDITRLVVHHSATGPYTSVEAIARYHVESNRWPAIAYHVVVTTDGDILYTGDLATVRYHAAGNNADTVGVCLIGDFTHRPPPKAQQGAARQILAELQYQLGAHLPVVGHRDVTRTACPGDTWPQWRHLIIPPGTEGGELDNTSLVRT